jgi:hypothetical protein
MQCYCKVVALTALAVVLCFAYAATGYRSAYIAELQTGSDSAAGPWLGSPNCPTDFSYFSATDNPHPLAIALSARLAGKNLRVYVDDALPKSSGGHCKITYLSLLPD